MEKQKQSPRDMSGIRAEQQSHSGQQAKSGQNIAWPAGRAARWLRHPRADSPRIPVINRNHLHLARSPPLAAGFALSGGRHHHQHHRNFRRHKPTSSRPKPRSFIARRSGEIPVFRLSLSFPQIEPDPKHLPEGSKIKECSLLAPPQPAPARQGRHHLPPAQARRLPARLQGQPQAVRQTDELLLRPAPPARPRRHAAAQRRRSPRPASASPWARSWARRSTATASSAACARPSARISQPSTPRSTSSCTLAAASSTSTSPPSTARSPSVFRSIQKARRKAESGRLTTDLAPIKSCKQSVLLMPHHTSSRSNQSLTCVASLQADFSAPHR